jgi:hypothetical protein
MTAVSLLVFLISPVFITVTASPTTLRQPHYAFIDCLSNHTCIIGPDKVASCIPISSLPTPIPQREVCGSNICPPNQSCCNPSCGICTPPGKGCVKLLCGPGVTYEPGPDPEPKTTSVTSSATNTPCLTPTPLPNGGTIECGPNICAADQFCCNALCGYCMKQGEGCTKEFCGLK